MYFILFSNLLIYFPNSKSMNCTIEYMMILHWQTSPILWIAVYKLNK